MRHVLSVYFIAEMHRHTRQLPPTAGASAMTHWASALISAQEWFSAGEGGYDAERPGINSTSAAARVHTARCWDGGHANVRLAGRMILRLGEGGSLSPRFHFRIYLDYVGHGDSTTPITRTDLRARGFVEAPWHAGRGIAQTVVVASTTPASSALSCWRGGSIASGRETISGPESRLACSPTAASLPTATHAWYTTPPLTSPLGAAITPIGQRSWRMFAPFCAPSSRGYPLSAAEMKLSPRRDQPARRRACCPPRGLQTSIASTQRVLGPGADHSALR